MLGHSWMQCDTRPARGKGEASLKYAEATDVVGNLEFYKTTSTSFKDPFKG